MYKKRKPSNKNRKEDNDDNCGGGHKKYLVIVESPSKCSSIEKYLGEDYQCIASCGHIKTIKSLKSINSKNNFETTYDVIETKKQQIEKMRKIINRYDKEYIYLATDDDKEGCAIAYHTAVEFDLPIETTKKITFNEITKNAITKAIQEPKTINMKTVKSQQARQILDMLIGYKISPVLWKHIYFSKTKCLSAGRCQTVSLRLVYENYLKMKENAKEKKYRTRGNFFKENILFDLNKDFDEKDEVRKFFEKSKTHIHTFNIGDRTEKTKSAPKPLNTSNLLQMANNVLKMSPKQTMAAAQKLYQMGHITYHRTENRKYSKEFLEKAKNYLIKKYNNERYVGNLEILENIEKINPHEGIRVTCIDNMELSGGSGVENHHINALYKMIWKNTIKSCMSDAKYVNYLITIDAPKNHKYTANLEIPIFLGWTILGGGGGGGGDGDQENTIENAENTLNYLKSLKNKTANVNWLDADMVQRQKQQYYTESTLIKKLEELQIGRPSTYNLFIETIQEKEYVKKMDIEGVKEKCANIRLKDGEIKEIEIEKIFGNEKNKLIIQPLGILCIDFLLKNFSEIFDYDYTKQMEEELDLIEHLNDDMLDANWYKICEKTLDNIKSMIKKTASLKKETYKFDDSNELIFCKNGPMIKSKKENEEFEFLPINKDVKLDLEKLRKGEYELDNILCFKNSFLGTYQDTSLNIFVGQYGPYLKWGDNTKCLKDMDKPLNEITCEDAIIFIENNGVGESKNESKNEKILRVLNDEMSVRKGKWGFYIFYKNKNMKTPKFVNLKKCPYKFFDCDKDELIEWTMKQVK
jgi:DNA topoisomerase-1